MVGALSSSHVSVSGPASGHALIVLLAIQQTGTYRGFLTAVALSGLLQIAFGINRRRSSAVHRSRHHGDRIRF